MGVKGVEIDGVECRSEEEWGAEILKACGVEPIWIHFPEQEYDAVENRVALDFNNGEICKMVREAIKKTHPELSSSEANKRFTAAKQRYSVRGVPLTGDGLTNALDRAVNDWPSDELPTTNEFIHHIAKYLMEALTLLEESGVCTLGLAHKIRINTKEEDTNGENEHETVQSLASSVRSSQ